MGPSALLSITGLAEAACPAIRLSGKQVTWVLLPRVCTLPQRAGRGAGREPDGGRRAPRPSEGRCGPRPGLAAKGSRWALGKGCSGLPPPVSTRRVRGRQAGPPGRGPARSTADRFLEPTMSLPVSSLYWHPARLTLSSSESGSGGRGRGRHSLLQTQAPSRGPNP